MLHLFAAWHIMLESILPNYFDVPTESFTILFLVKFSANSAFFLYKINSCNYYNVVTERSACQFSTRRSKRFEAEAKKHTTFCMNNLYFLRATKYSLRFSKYLHCKHLTSRGPMFLQLCSFRVSRPLVQSDDSYLRDAS